MVTLNKKKLFQIENLIEKFDPVIIFVQECDIADDYDIKLLNIKGYTTEMGQNLINHNKARILAYVKNKASTTRRIDLEEPENEIIVIDHKHQHGITRVQGIYRPFTSVTGVKNNNPDEDRRLHKLLNNTGNNILTDGTNVILGDFNVNAIKPHKYSDIMTCYESEFGLDQIIFEITRQRQIETVKGTEHQESCLDLVFTDDIQRILEKEVIFCPESDHSAVMVKLKFNDTNGKYSKIIWSRDYTQYNQSEALSECMSINWAEMCIQAPDLDDNYEALISKLQEMYDKHCPMKKIVITERKKIGSHILTNQEKRRQNLYKKMKKRKMPEDVDIYKAHLKKMKQKREKLRKVQINKILKSRSSKDIWSLYNKMSGNIKEPDELKLKTDSGTTTTDPKTCADQFAKAFHDKVDKLRSKTKPKIQTEQNIDTLPRPIYDGALQFTTEEIQKVIYLAPNSRSAGTDGIDVTFLKSIMCEEILIVFKFLFEKCAAVGRTPLQWKISKIIPLLKKGDPQQPENYRPISNLNLLGKVYEKLILKRVWALMGDSLPSSHQHGFRPNHSTETATTTIFSIINKLVENKRKVILVTLDMSAAFDLLDKTILIPKLRAHGFPEKIISIYQDFLSDRKAVVQVGDTYSETFNLEVGCVQGSPSGPLLFSLLVNNISDAIQQGQIVCYADDSYLIFDGGSWSDVSQTAGTETTKVVEWLKDIGMVVNTSKTESIYFSKQDQDLEVDVSSCKIKVGKTMRVLGVIFDSKMSWEAHINNIASNIKKKIHALRKISSDLNHSERLSVAHGSIYSVLYYAAGTWLNDHLSIKLKRILKGLSNSILRIVFGKRIMDCDTQQLHSLAHMLTPAQMTFYSPGCFLQKTLATKLPVKLYEMAIQQVKYKERTDETLLTKTFTQTFGLARFPNNAYEAMKLTKGDVSQCPVFNFKKILKKAINEKFQ